MISRPQSNEYAPFYAGYIRRVPEDSDLFELLSQQPDELRALLETIYDSEAGIRPVPGQWSVKEMIGHLCDSERIFSYRALRFARGDSTPLPGFEQDDYVRTTDFNRRSLVNLIDEFAAQRRANSLCFRALSDDELQRRGVASNAEVSVRALLYIMAGHVLHHIESLKTDYKLNLRSD